MNKRLGYCAAPIANHGNIQAEHDTTVPAFNSAKVVPGSESGTDILQSEPAFYKMDTPEYQRWTWEASVESALDRYIVTRPQLITEVNEEVDETEVLRYLGYPVGRSPSVVVKASIRPWIKAASRLAAPQAAYLILPVSEKTSNRLRVRSNCGARPEMDWSAPAETEFRGSIGQFLGVSRLIVVFIATAGPKIERLASQLMAEGEALPSLIVNAVGCERAEAAESAVIDRVREQTREIGLAPTLPYSPGYCGMALTEQKRLFALFDGHTAGVTLSPKCLMLPIKSISGLVGLAPQEELETIGSPCQRCELERCNMRR